MASSDYNLSQTKGPEKKKNLDLICPMPCGDKAVAIYIFNDKPTFLATSCCQLITTEAH